MEEFVKLISQGKVNVKKLISREFDIADVQSAYETLLEGKEDIIAVVLKYDQQDVVKPISRIVTTSKRKIEKSKKNINITVIGAGGISKSYHLPNLKKIKGANIYAIVSGTGVNAKKVAKEYNANYCTTDYKEVLEDKDVIAGTDTLFLGEIKHLDNFERRCDLCGECIQDLFFGLCPVARCPKHMLNGPCGGSKEGKCEVYRDMDCVWYLVIKKMHERGELDKLKEIRSAKDWSKSNEMRMVL